MYMLIRLKEGVKAHAMAGFDAKATAPHLGKPTTAKTMRTLFVANPTPFAEISRASWIQLLVG